jgi:hypothetical protein
MTIVIPYRIVSTYTRLRNEEGDEWYVVEVLITVNRWRKRGRKQRYERT